MSATAPDLRPERDASPSPRRAAPPPASTPPPLRVVPRPVSRRARRRRVGLAAIVGVGAVFLLMLGLVAFQAEIAADQLRLDRLQKQLGEAQDRYGQLRLQVAELESPEHVAAAAGQLGLVQRSPDQVTYLKPTPAVVGAVTAADGPPTTSGPSGDAGAQDWSKIKPLLKDSP